MTQPIQIYLDSSDFSKFSNLEKQPREYEEVLEYLTQKRNDGVITMHFSEAHVIEAAPTSPAAIPAAMERFRIIKELCGKNCLIHPIDLWDIELSNQNLDGNNKKKVVRNDGNWMPKLFDLSEMLPDVEKLLVEDLKHLGRAKRRLYLKNEKPTALAYAERAPSSLIGAEELSRQLPLNMSALNVVRKYFIGKSTRAQALNALQECFSDLEEFGRWYKKNWSAASELSQHLRSSGEEFKNKLLEARVKLDTLMKEGAASGYSAEKLQNLFKQTFVESLPVNSHRMINVNTKALDQVDDPWKTEPGMTCTVTLAMHVARRSVMGVSPRVPSHSDFPDCYHAVYLPYVDIYRPDSFMESMLKECNMPFPTVVVDKLLKLPSAIEKMIAERKNSAH